MKISANNTLPAALLILAVAISPASQAAGEKDCLLQGTIEHGASADEATQVNIHSVGRYNDETRCKVRRGQKMEFRLPSDERVQQAPSGSEVKYRYRTDEQGTATTELISISA